MKLGCSSWSYHQAFTDGRLDQVRWLRMCAEELELDGVELLDIHFPSVDGAYCRALKKACTDLHLTISCVSVSNDFGVADNEARQQEIEKVKQWVEVASFFGAPVLRVFAGWLPQGEETVPASSGMLGGLRRAVGMAKEPKEQRWPNVIAALAECAAYASERGITLGLENHNGRGIVGTADEVERCLRDVGSPWCRLNLDTGDYGDLGSIRRTVNSAVHVHAKLYELDGDGVEQRQDWQAIMGILSDARYRGFLSIEYEGEEDPMTAVPRGVRYLRRLIRASALAVS